MTLFEEKLLSEITSGPKTDHRGTTSMSLPLLDSVLRQGQVLVVYLVWLQLVAFKYRHHGAWNPMCGII